MICVWKCASFVFMVLTNPLIYLLRVMYLSYAWMHSLIYLLSREFYFIHLDSGQRPSIIKNTMPILNWKFDTHPNVNALGHFQNPHMDAIWYFVIICNENRMNLIATHGWTHRQHTVTLSRYIRFFLVKTTHFSIWFRRWRIKKTTCQLENSSQFFFSFVEK